MDPISAAALVISVITAVSQAAIGLKLRHCHAACCDSDCKPQTPSSTPITRQPTSS